jgi:hypothetical protein
VFIPFPVRAAQAGGVASIDSLLADGTVWKTEL